MRQQEKKGEVSIPCAATRILIEEKRTTTKMKCRANYDSDPPRSAQQLLLADHGVFSSSIIIVMILLTTARIIHRTVNEELRQRDGAT